jgi:hypothetical protein
VRALARLALTAAALVAAGCGSAGAPSAATPVTNKRLLVVTYTAGFRHESIPVAERTIASLGAAGFYATDYCRSQQDVATMLTAAGLAKYDGVFFANTTGDLGIPDMAAFLAWIGDGHAFVGAHSAADTNHESAAYLAMLGGEFVAHGAIVEAELRLDDPADVSVAPFGARVRMTDEWYRFAGVDRGSVHMLLSMNRVPADGVGEGGTAADLPIAWRKAHGRGRVFYTALGHRDEVWQDPRFQQHLVAALRWALASPL